MLKVVYFGQAYRTTSARHVKSAGYATGWHRRKLTCPQSSPNPPVDHFQTIAADYFSLQGVKFLVVVDRFSGWPHLMKATGSDEAQGPSGLIRCLKFMFATFGVPEEVNSDGGPEFVAAETQAFLGKGVSVIGWPQLTTPEATAGLR